ncbi:MAG: hypothetical protein EOP06_10480 [Proteobacteria bacterium]|nr:MAG: hypothetical protein EOP06_10480 [Pseudomonadota bacterium]
MKKVLVAMIAIVLWSCSDDDSANSAKRLPTSVVVTNPAGASQTVAFTYDENNRLTSMATDIITSFYSYDDKGRMKNITFSDQSLTFAYGSDKKLASMTLIDGTVYPVVWTDSNTFALYANTFELSPDNDALVWNDTQYGREGGKGAFADVRNFNALMTMITNTQAADYVSKKALSSITTDGDGKAVTITRDEFDFPQIIAIEGGNTYTIEYTEQ